MAKVIKSTHLPDEAGQVPDVEEEFDELSPRRGAHVQKRDVIEAKSERQRILEEAEASRDEIIRIATESAEDLKAAARSEGYKEGKTEAVREVQEFVAQIAARFRQHEANIEPQLRTLAITIARKIIGKELEFHPEAVVDLVKQALSEKARQRLEVYLRVNPEDYALIREHKGELVEVLSRCKEIGIREDPTVARFGVVIETDAGSIDGQLETQLEIFERVLQEAGAMPD